VFLGRQVTQHKQVSDDTAHIIDVEIRRVIDANYTRAKEILTTNLDKLHIMADALVKYETIDEQQIKDIMAGKTPKPPADWDDSVGTPPPKRPEGEAEGGGTIGSPAGQH
jgi:cell division protease FtsH